MSYFLSDKNLEVNKSFEISGQEAAHILLARRIKIGEKIKLQGPDRNRFLCDVLSFTKKNLTVKILEALDVPKESGLEINLFQALIAENALDSILQKSTELGVSKVILFNAKNTPAHLSDKVAKKLERWNKIAQEAAKQSDRVVPAEVLFENNIDNALKSQKDIFLLEKTAKVSFQGFAKNKLKSIGILIGPEGGFTDQEVEKFSKMKNITSIKLGPRILRADTAAMASISIVQSLFGDL